jgi:L-2-hydroxyglutarate oxidase LhgO
MDADIVVIGAGVVGLAIAAELASPGRVLYVLEKNEKFGQETSSRNSEVIHGGLYYRPGSLKAALCLEGNRLLYDLASRHEIPHRNLGKLIVACDDAGERRLEKLLHNARESGVEQIGFLTAAEIASKEPHISARAALFSPTTGIIDSHRLMRHYLVSTEEKGGELSYRSRVEELHPEGEGYRVKVAHSCCNVFEFTTRIVINAAGLEAHHIAAMLGHGATIHYCKGDYFSVGNGKNRLIDHLIYPPPESAGLGIHATLDTGGRMRLGPDTEYTGSYIDYSVREEKKTKFFEAARLYLPFLEPGDLSPDQSGIRPKLQGPGEDFRDFEITFQPPGTVHLVGIESPGLTASPAIARHVAAMLREKDLI